MKPYIIRKCECKRWHIYAVKFDTLFYGSITGRIVADLETFSDVLILLNVRDYSNAY